MRVPLDAASLLNHTWAIHFIGDTLYGRRQYRIVHVLDEGNREAPAVKVDTALPGECVVTPPEQLTVLHGAPRRTHCDNGAEFVATAVADWASRHAVHRAYIERGKPNQNADIERFKCTYRPDVLDTWVFTTLDEVRELSQAWRQTNNTVRSHERLGRVPRLTNLPRLTSAEPSENVA